jgi:hypothetical protein
MFIGRAGGFVPSRNLCAGGCVEKKIEVLLAK